MVKASTLKHTNVLKNFLLRMVSSAMKEYRLRSFTKYFAWNTFKQAYLHVWPSALFVASKVQKIVRSNPALNHLQCHVGKQLIPVDSFCNAFLPPGNSELFQMYNRFTEAGVMVRWYEEVKGWAHSRRVQDRSMVKNPTRTIIDQNTSSNVRMDGRIQNLFLFCLLLCMLSSIVFVCEFFV